MIPAPHDQDMERLLRAAIQEHREAAMTMTDTDEELRRWQSSMRRTSSRRTTVLAIAASVAVLAAGGAGYALLGDGDGAPVETVAAPRDLRSDETVSTTTLPGGAGSVDVLGGEVVVATGPALVAVDPATGEITRQVPGGDGEIQGPVAATSDGLWTSYWDGETEQYARVDVTAGRVTTTVSVGESYWIASGGAGLWAVAAGQDVVRLDPVTGAELDRVTLPFRPFGLWVTQDAVWAQAAIGGRLARIDAATGTISPGPTLAGSAPGVLVGEELWVVEPTTAQVVRLDARDGSELGRTTLPGVPTGGERDTGYLLGEDGEAVYVTTAASDGERLLLRLDASDGAVRDAVRLPNGPRPFFVDSTGDAVWLAAPGSTELLQLAPPTR